MRNSMQIKASVSIWHVFTQIINSSIAQTKISSTCLRTRPLRRNLQNLLCCDRRWIVFYRIIQQRMKSMFWSGFSRQLPRKWSSKIISTNWIIPLKIDKSIEESRRNCIKFSRFKPASPGYVHSMRREFYSKIAFQHSHMGIIVQPYGWSGEWADTAEACDWKDSTNVLKNVTIKCIPD